MDAALKKAIDDNLAAVSAKQLDAAVAGFAVDGVLIDPHYPVTRMVGREAIAAGLGWMFGAMRELNFEVDRYFGDGSEGGAIEVTSRHVLGNGRIVGLQQMFVIEARGGLITRWQAYEPYGPHGIAGLIPRLARLRHGRSRG